MKTRRLSEIDLARLTALTDQAMLEHALRAYNAGGGAWSYDPVRASTSDILGAVTPLLGVLPPLSWSQIKRQIEVASKRGEAQAKANAQVGKILFDRSKREGWSAVKYPMGLLPIGNGESVRYWNDVVVEDELGLFIPFIDHRREHGISNPSVRQVVFSMQHQWIRERHPDLAEARLAILRFPSLGDDRGFQIEFHREADLFSYDELDTRVRNVYLTWAKVSAERASGDRKKAAGSGGLF